MIIPSLLAEGLHSSENMGQTNLFKELNHDFDLEQCNLLSCMTVRCGDAPLKVAQKILAG